MSGLEKRKIFASHSSFFSLENLQLISLHFENGFFIAISPKETLKLGTMALSLPIAAREEFSRNRGASQESERSFLSSKLPREGLITTNVLGSRNEIAARALAEKVTQATAKMTYLSLNFKENEEQLLAEAIKLIELFLEENSH